jgi:capsular polysaccharide biosynthesis protein
MHRLRSSPVFQRVVGDRWRELRLVVRHWLRLFAALWRRVRRDARGIPLCTLSIQDLSAQRCPTVVQAPGGTLARTTPRCGDGTCQPFDTVHAALQWEGRSWFELHNVHVVGNRYVPAVVVDGQALVRELSPDVYGAHNHPLLASFRFAAEQHVAGCSLMLATPEARGNFGHWMFDLLPRLQPVVDGRIQIDRILLDKLPTGFELDSLIACGIDPERVTVVQPGSRLLCERLIASTLRKQHWQQALDTDAFSFVRQVITPHHTDRTRAVSRRLWLSRRRSGFRRVLNEEAIDPVLDQLGFDILFPEDYSLGEQAAIFEQATVVAGPHTSAMVNWMFCRPGTPVLEIASPHHHDVSFWTVASHARLEYHWMVGVGVKSTPCIPDAAGSRYVNYELEIDFVADELDRLCRQCVD